MGNLIVENFVGVHTITDIVVTKGGNIVNALHGLNVSNGQKSPPIPLPADTYTATVTFRDPNGAITAITDTVAITGDENTVWPVYQVPPLQPVVKPVNLVK